MGAPHEPAAVRARLQHAPPVEEDGQGDDEEREDPGRQQVRHGAASGEPAAERRAQRDGAPARGAAGDAGADEGGEDRGAERAP